MLVTMKSKLLIVTAPASTGALASAPTLVSNAAETADKASASGTLNATQQGPVNNVSAQLERLDFTRGSGRRARESRSGSGLKRRSRKPICRSTRLSPCPVTSP